MSELLSLPTRRQALVGAGLVPLLGTVSLGAQPKKKPRVAAIYTVFRHRSHAHDIIENFLAPYYFDGKLIEPPVEVVSLYADQRVPEGDMTDDVAKQFKLPIFKTIAEALTLGGKELAVDAVLSIGEHGEYPLNELGQKEYPRKRFFDEIVTVMQRSNRFVPIFNDKHLSFRWDWAKEMVQTSKKHGFALLAGSSVPLAQRVPSTELAAGTELEEAVSIHGGGLESYDFHGLEILQSIVEARKGGEVGIRSVEFLSGDALWRAADAGRFSVALAEAALAADLEKSGISPKKIPGEESAEPHGILLQYKDGFRATMLKLGGKGTRWCCAYRAKGEAKPTAFRYYVGPWKHRNLFKALSHAIQHMFTTGKAPWPIERTLLTTGTLAAAMLSRQQGKALVTPHLEIAYEPTDFRAMRESGASWKIITEETPELKGINPNGDLKKK